MRSTFCLLLICALLLLSACQTAAPEPTQDLTRTSTLDLIPESTSTGKSPDPAIEHSYGGESRDRGINLVQTRDGGFAAVGYSSSFGSGDEDIYLVRTDPDGKFLWSRTYGGAGDDNGWDLLETPEGGFLILGFTNSMGAGKMDLYLIQTDPQGELIWEMTYGGPEDDYGWALESEDDGYLLAGQTKSFGAGDIDGFLVKVNLAGEPIWRQTYGGTAEDRLYSIDQTISGGYVLAGTTRTDSLGERDAYLIKTDFQGELIWSSSFGEEQDDVFHAVRETSEGDLIACGYSKSFGAAGYDAWLMNIDSNGEPNWQRLFGGTLDDRLISGEQTVDGGYILAGYTRSFGASGWDVLLAKLDPDGELIWTELFGGRLDDTGYTVIQATAGDYLVTGETYSQGAGGGDLYLIHFND